MIEGEECLALLTYIVYVAPKTASKLSTFSRALLFPSATMTKSEGGKVSRAFHSYHKIPT